MSNEQPPPAGMTESDITQFLLNNPSFFERHAGVLANVQLTSPHGSRAVSLQERQAELLREKIRGLEHKIVELFRNSQENVLIADRLHRWTTSLMLTSNAAELPAVLEREMQHHFMVPQVGLRLWGVSPGYAGEVFAQGVSADLKSFAGSLTQPFCGMNSGFEAAQWLHDPASVSSLALIPLNQGNRCFGLLVLASPDPTRYTADMGTDFLIRIGELAAAALARLLPRDPVKESANDLSLV